MYNSPSSPKKRFVIIGLSLLTVVVLFVVVFLILSSHEGEYKVTLSVMPEDAILSVDEEEILGTEVWVDQGEHTFSAKKDGFDTDYVTRTITADTTVTLLPSPVSDEALTWASQSDISSKLESFGGAKANERGSYITGLNPIISLLPYVDISGPFKIDYGYHGADNTATYLIIHKTTPTGRQNALAWIREQGYDPTQLDIRFTDFENPLLGGVS